MFSVQKFLIYTINFVVNCVATGSVARGVRTTPTTPPPSQLRNCANTIFFFRVVYHVSCVFGSPNPNFCHMLLHASQFYVSLYFSETGPPQTARVS